MTQIEQTIQEIDGIYPVQPQDEESRHAHEPERAASSLFTTRGHLHPTPPFDFGKTLAFLGLFTPAQDEQILDGGVLTKAGCFGGQTVAFRVASTGAVEAPAPREEALTYALFSESEIAPPLEERVAAHIDSYLSLDDDLRPFYKLAQADPHFAPVLEQFYGYHQVKFPTPFENACWAVLSQHTPMPSARKAKQAITERFGSSISVDGEVLWAFPEPDRLAGAGVDELEATIGNLRKAQYIGAVGRAFAQVDESFLKTAPYEEADAWLRRIRGIGTWSAAFVLLRGVGRMERVPLDEKALAQAVSRVYLGGKLAARSDLERLAERYGPWRGYWAHYLRAAT